MPDVKPQLPRGWHEPEEPSEPKASIDVEESRRGAMSRSAAITDFEEARAAIWDEDGNERPTPELIIALEAAAIVNTRRATEGGNARLDAMVAGDAERIKSRVR